MLVVSKRSMLDVVEVVTKISLWKRGGWWRGLAVARDSP